MIPTDEQDKVASSEAQTLVVNAFAGTGKTSTLVEYARRRPNQRLIYIAFNKSVKEEAKTKFPRNVRCVTSHGLAYATHGVQYKSKLGNPRAYHFARALSLDTINAGRVLNTITQFIISTDSVIDDRHALLADPKASTQTRSSLVSCAQRGWQMMQDTSNRDVPMSHDGYFKLYQMTRPRIDADSILFDEAQDANPITLELVANQSSNKVFVGDQYQTIYGFRGAVNALSSIPADERLLLSSSFRFGSGVADLATALLHDWRGCKTAVNGNGQHPTVFKVDQGKPHAVISRGNSRLFAEAVMLMQTEIPFGFAGGIEGYRLELILDSYWLFRNQRNKVRDPLIASFNDFAAMQEYGEELGDAEIKALVAVVQMYIHEIPELVACIKDVAISKLTGQEVALSTAHKAKGLEWMDVVLTDNFTDLKYRRDFKTGAIVAPDPEEINILYVAATRAMRGLCLPCGVRDWLHESGRFDLLKHVTETPLVVVRAVTNRNLNEEAERQFKAIKAQIDTLHAWMSASGAVGVSGFDLARTCRTFLQDQADTFKSPIALNPTIETSDGGQVSMLSPDTVMTD